MNIFIILIIILENNSQPDEIKYSIAKTLPSGNFLFYLIEVLIFIILIIL
jgi:hypothetical protein